MYYGSPNLLLFIQILWSTRQREDPDDGLHNHDYRKESNKKEGVPYSPQLWQQYTCRPAPQLLRQGNLKSAQRRSPRIPSHHLYDEALQHGAWERVNWSSWTVEQGEIDGLEWDKVEAISRARIMLVVIRVC